MSTKAQVARTNAVSYAQFLIEFIAANPGVKDIYFDDHTPAWTVYYTDGSVDEFETFQDVMTASTSA